MGLEIERRFLVASDRWRQEADAGTELAQGYLLLNPGRTTRIRRSGQRYLLTIKVAEGSLAVRHEFEYEVPAADGEAMLALCTRPPIRKRRHLLPAGAVTWEIDVFADANAPLVIAEVELPAADAGLELPSWIGAEVTEDGRYINANLYERPFSSW